MDWPCTGHPEGAEPAIRMDPLQNQPEMCERGLRAYPGQSRIYLGCFGYALAVPGQGEGGSAG